MLFVMLVMTIADRCKPQLYASLSQFNLDHGCTWLLAPVTSMLQAVIAAGASTCQGCLALRAHSQKSLNFNATRAALTVQ